MRALWVRGFRSSVLVAAREAEAVQEHQAAQKGFVAMAVEKRGLSPAAVARVSKRPCNVSEEQVNATLEALETRVGLAPDQLEKVVLKTPCLFRIDAVSRLDAIIGCFELHSVQKELLQKLVMGRTRWIFSPLEAGFKSSIENMNVMLPFYEKLGLPQHRWFWQAPHRLRAGSKVDLDASMNFLVKFAGEEGAKQIIHRYPEVVHINIEKQMIPRLEKYRSCGLSEQELVKLVCTFPKLLDVPYEENFLTKCAFFEQLGFSESDMAKLLVTFPRFPTSSKKDYSRKVDFFVECGISSDKVKVILRKCPKLLGLSLENQLKPKVDFLKSLGICGESFHKFLLHHPDVLFKNLGKLEARITSLGKFGFTQEQYIELIRKQPSMLNYRVELVEQKLDFLKRVAKLHPAAIVAFPSYLTFSLEGRLKPRLHTVATLYLNGCARKQYSIGSILTLPEILFRRRFLARKDVDYAADTAAQLPDSSDVAAEMGLEWSVAASGKAGNAAEAAAATIGEASAAKGPESPAMTSAIGEASTAKSPDSPAVVGV